MQSRLPRKNVNGRELGFQRKTQHDCEGSKQRLWFIGNHNPHSNDGSTQTHIVNDCIVRVLSWYDNERDFSCRLCDTAVALAKLLWAMNEKALRTDNDDSVRSGNRVGGKAG
jgi:hypothetical protein